MSYGLNWFRSYRLLLHWQALSLKPILPIFMVVQLFTGIGTVIGFGFLIPSMDTNTAMFLVTGAPTLALIVLGLVMLPQFVAQAKSEGKFEYMWSLPIPRMAYLAADLTIWLLATLPGVVLALIVGSARYGFELHVSPLAVLAFLLVALTATTIGYSMAHVSPKAELVGVITQFLVFCLFLFSPINFPAERLPEWLANVHSVLPVKHAADAVRGTLTDGYGDRLGLAMAVLAAWCLVGFGITYAAMTRRR